MALDYGGDDVSELYLRLLERINLPYKERINVDLARTWEWRMMEDLKGKSASLAEVSARNLFLYHSFSCLSDAYCECVHWNT